MGFLNRLFGFRWSLYVVQNGNQLIYAMHENSVMRMIGYVEGYFSGGKSPVDPWSLFINFNHKHKAIKLGPEHFTPDGEDITPLLIQQIESIDPGWKVKGNEPIFEEVATKKRLKIMEHDVGQVDLHAMFDDVDKPRELTFFRVMDQVFSER